MAIIQSGYFTSAGTAVDVNITDIISDFDAFHLYVQGDATGSVWESTANPGVVKEAHWFRGMASGAALTTKNTNGAATDTKDFLATGGFVPYSYSNPPTYAVQAITSITKANPAVVTITGHGYATGDIVRIYNNTVMDQLGGLEWSITVIDANTFSIPINTNVANFTAETSASAQKLFKLSDFYPQKAYITGITAANPAVITTSTAHGYVAGQKIRVKCPSVFGMTQIDGLLATVASVTTTTITTDIDSSSFTAFGWPAATAVPISYAEVHPVGEDNGILTAAERNIGTRGMIIGAALQTASAKTYWVAEKSDRFSAS